MNDVIFPLYSCQFQRLFVFLHVEEILKGKIMKTTVRTRPEAIARFKAAKERKRVIVEELKKELSERYEKRTGQKPTSFFVL